MTTAKSSMTAAQGEEKEYTPFQFRVIYAGMREKGSLLRKPIFTQERLQQFIEKYKYLMDMGEEEEKTITFQDIRGSDISVTHLQDWKTKARALRFTDSEGRVANIPIKEGDRIHIDYQGIMQLAAIHSPDDVEMRLQPKGVSVEDIKTMFFIQRFAHLFINVDYHYDNVRDHDSFEAIDAILPGDISEWEDSALCKKLTQILEAESKANRLPEINKVVCFGCGCLTAKKGLSFQRGNIQHIAARTIADILSKAQGNVVEVFAQEPLYTENCKRLLAKHLKIEAVDFNSAEGFAKIDKNTFVLDIGATAPVLELAADLASPSGPAGLWHYKLAANAEKVWQGRTTRGDFPKPPSGQNWVCDREWQYRLRCRAFGEVTDSEYFGFPTQVEFLVEPRYIWIDGVPHPDPERPQEPIIKKDKDGNDVTYKLDTELLLRRK